MDKVAVVAGENMYVTCPVAGYPIDTIQWEKGGRVLPVNRRQQVFPNGTLVIENVQRSLDQGSYTCIAKNTQGFSAKGNLEVQVMGELTNYNYFIRKDSSFFIRFAFQNATREFRSKCFIQLFDESLEKFDWNANSRRVFATYLCELQTWPSPTMKSPSLQKKNNCDQRTNFDKRQSCRPSIRSLLTNRSILATMSNWRVTLLAVTNRFPSGGQSTV